MGRFINADGYVSTGTGLNGFNMFAYCNNDPVNKVDFTGGSPEWWDSAKAWNAKKKEQAKAWIDSTIEAIGEWAYSVYYDVTTFHFEKRAEKNGPHPSYAEVQNNPEWELLPESQSIYHDNGVGNPELKCAV